MIQITKSSQLVKLWLFYLKHIFCFHTVYADAKFMITDNMYMEPVQ